MRPYQAVFDGRVLVAGWLLDEELLGEAEIRRRVLALWRSGLELRRAGRWWIIALPKAEFRPVAQGPGGPLVRHERALLACPWPDRNVPTDGVWIVAQGELRCLEGLQTVDPADWIELDEIELWQARSLAALPPRPVLRAPVQVDLREKTGRPLTDQARALALALDPSKQSAGPPSWLVALVSRFKRAQASGPLKTALGWLDPVERLLGRALSRLGLDPWLQRLQATSVWKMLEQFDNGDLDEALRHAIPLSAKGPPETKTSPALWTGFRRDDLRLTDGRSRGQSLFLGQDVYAALTTRYRAAFKRLDRMGKIDDAVFVLAELLGQSEEAVLYLEKHERFRDAAELAEARTLAPGLVVRLWFRAGEVGRAVEVARASGAFRDAVDRLEKDHPDVARMVRRVWATQLVAAQDFAGAVALVRNDPLAVQYTPDWFEAGIAARGPGLASLLVDRLILFPERFSETRQQVLSLCADTSDLAQHDRVSLYQELGRVPAHGAPLARAALRSLVRDSGKASAPAALSALRRNLEAAARSASLSADLPAASVRTRPPRMDLCLPEGGTSTVLSDLCALPDGRLLVARGEAGCWLHASSLDALFRFEAPASHLIAGLRAPMALALARRDDVWQISRLDLRHRVARTWLSLQLDHFLDQHEDDSWTVVTRRSELTVLDLLAEHPRALWRVDLESPVLGLCAGPAELQITTVLDHGWQRWHYELPGRVLRARTTAKAESSNQVAALGPNRHKLFGRIDPSGPCLMRGSERVELPGEPRIWPCGDGLAAQCEGAVYLLGSEGLARIELPQDPGRLIVRGVNERFLVASDRGGLVWIDLALGRVLAMGRLL